MPYKRRQAHASTKENAHAQYTEEERVKAVAVLTSMGGATPQAVEQVSKLLGKQVNYSTLAHWQTELRPTIIQADQSLAPTEIDVPKIVRETRQKLLVNLASTIDKVSKRQNEDSVINAASLRDLSVTLGISAEKLLLMAGRTPEMDNLFQRLIQACEGTSYNPMSLLEDFITAVESRKQLTIEQPKQLE